MYESHSFEFSDCQSGFRSDSESGCVIHGSPSFPHDVGASDDMLLALQGKTSVGDEIKNGCY